MKKKNKRFALTLVEMMLVIVLISIVGGALAFNLKGALDRGKGFKTQETKKKIEAIVNIAAAERDDIDMEKDWETIVAKSPLIKLKTSNKNQILDGWGNPFKVEMDPIEDQFIATSPRIDAQGEIIEKK